MMHMNGFTLGFFFPKQTPRAPLKTQAAPQQPKQSDDHGENETQAAAPTPPLLHLHRHF